MYVSICIWNMHPSLFLAALCLGMASAAPRLDQSLDAHWSHWKAAHGKLYDKDEEGQRRTVWEKNLKMIDQHNEEYSQGQHSFMMAMNAFGDLKPEEGNVFQAPLFAEIPSSVDWREKGYVTPVKDQVRQDSATPSPKVKPKEPVSLLWKLRNCIQFVMF
uniref:Cathepsin propeptide inhibitor domain-containing protein n=1 Tax=Ursus americanus TaxID=9643 RepID=A0A452SU59_URSAM